MDEPFLRKIVPDPDRAYFLYIGEIKASGLNGLLRRPLERTYGKPVDCICIVPDVLSHYGDDHVMVINSLAREAFERTGIPHNLRPEAGWFAREVSSHPEVLSLIDQLVDRQGDLFVNVFESRPELSVVDGKRVRLIGPEPGIAVDLNNKINQYDIANRLGIPTPSGRGCDHLDQAVDVAAGYLQDGHRVFVSREFSAAGSNSIIAGSVDEIYARFSGEGGRMLVTRFIEHRHDPTVLGIVASEEEVYIASVADQKVVGTRFHGSTFPTVIDERTAREMVEMTRIIGRHMGGLGYRGAFGCDYIVDDRGSPYFIEINARKQGTTMETALTMLHCLPGHPCFPELEFVAVRDGRLPGNLREMPLCRSTLCWGTYNYKLEDDVQVDGSVAASSTERELFARAALGRSNGPGYVIMDHPGKGVRIGRGSFLARVIAAASSHAEVRRSLVKGIDQVGDTLGQNGQADSAP